MPEVSYASHAELLTSMSQDVLDQLSIESGGSQDNATVDAVLVDASRMMDGYLGERYVIPIVGAVPLSVLRPYCKDIARYLLFERRTNGKYDAGLQATYLGALKFLQLVATRKAGIPGAAELIAAPDTGDTTMGSQVAVFLDPNDATIEGML